MINIKSLNKRFNKGKSNEIHVINDVSLELPECGMVAIFGRSGCGKTTLLNVIGGLDKFDSGSVSLFGSDIRHSTDELRNRYVGYIFQNYNLNREISNFDNVADALRLCGVVDEDVIKTRVFAALRNVGMEKYASRTPDMLSGGQQQRIAIARAIVKNPRIILADEPTGNLDSSNTVMIMDLLKQISKEHLVLLVTHEANLVDYYCDKVIELSDGKVVGIRDNESANGYREKDKNSIYLGEFEKSVVESENAVIDFYGDPLDTPVKIKIVNDNGKLYLKIDNSKVKILDPSSEIKLLDGVYEERKHTESTREIDMSELPEISGEKLGRLFTLKSSIKSGYITNFRTKKKSVRTLRACMGLFAAILVLSVSLFGTAVSDLITVNDSYSHYTFYLYTPDAEVSKEILSAYNAGEYGIDSISLLCGRSTSTGDRNVNFRAGFFETFGSDESYDYGISSNSVYLSIDLADELTLVEGEKEDLDKYQVLISTALADELLESSTYGYVSEYRDLIGLITDSLYYSSYNLRIAGIVESDEKAVYVDNMILENEAMGETQLYVSRASDTGYSQPSDGEAIFIKGQYSYGEVADDYNPNVGDVIKIHGKEFTVTQVIQFDSDYSEWIKSMGIEMPDVYTYAEQIMQNEYPDLVFGSEGYASVYEKVLNENFYAYYDYYYSYARDFAEMFNGMNPYSYYPEQYLSGNETAKYILLGDDTYYKVSMFKQMYGRYPVANSDDEELLYSMSSMYEEDIYEYYGDLYIDVENCYIINDNDYSEICKMYGETDKSAIPYWYWDFKYEDPWMMYYTVIHTTDPESTEAYLEDNFSHLDTGYEYLKAIVTPDDIRNENISDRLVGIITGFVAIAAIIVVMSICMYFIMRSSLLGKVKEVGIYRAIGVSKKNLTFRYFIESAVFTTLTVFVGVALVSIVMLSLLGNSNILSTVFFYPPWMCAVMLVLVYGICLLCGILPITRLLRKTPSEILAKYDI